jgi:TetR/AcrR family transcriptional regulator, transcriptional repressor for nem operon
MARPREFDADAVLNAAMRMFWERGYRATSVQDVMQAAGIQKQSLYCAFGDKRSLFLKCLDLYANQTLLELRKILKEDISPLEAIRRVLHYVFRAPDPDNLPAGCLMANAALELGLEDPEVAKAVGRMFRAFEKLVAPVVQKGQEQGEIDSRVDSVALAQSLVNTINGLRILERTGASKQQMQRVVETALMAIRR